MKYLELDARHPECHGLARALVGSPTCEFSGTPLVGILRDKFFMARSADDVSKIWESCLYEISLPLDALKLCHFMAMREKITVLGVCDERQNSGFIDRVYEYGGCLLASVGNWNFGISEITLDLDNLPKGARIVEDSK